MVLFVVAALQGLLPFTPVSARLGPRVVIIAVILSGAFLYLAVSSWVRPARSFWGGFGLLGFLVFVSSLTGLSPVEELWGIKLLSLAVLAFGGLAVRPALEGVDP